MSQSTKKSATGANSSSNQSRSLRERAPEQFQILKKQQDQVKHWEDVDYEKLGNFKISR
jgi:hypothetical protein